MSAEMQNTVVIQGDANVPSMALKQSQVNHLRRLLAWLRVEYFLDADMQRGIVSGSTASVAQGVDVDKASAVLQQFADKINSVPAPVREAIAVLTAVIRQQERPRHNSSTTELVPASNQLKSLRLILAWMSTGSMEAPVTIDSVSQPLQVPAYISMAVKMLSKAIASHEASVGVVESSRS